MGDPPKPIETQEALLVSYLGYIRFPAAFRKRFGTPKNYPEGTAKYVVDESAGEVRLTYTFPLRKLVNANRKRRTTRKK